MKKFIKPLPALVVLAVIGLIVYASYNKVMKMYYKIEYTGYVENYSKEYGVDRLLIYAIIHTESKFKPDATSEVGAMGLMQITPDTFKWAQFRLNEQNHKTEELFDPETNIKFGTYIMAMHLKEFGSIETAAAAYHSGRGSVNKWLKDEKYSKDGKTLQAIPFKDTDEYVKKLVKTYNIYKRLYEK